MDTVETEELEHYRRVIQDMLRHYATFRPSVGDVQIGLILDPSLDHYELIYGGWNGPYRIHGSVLHLDIRGGKVWIQHDGTEEGIASELVEAGIPADRIVLAFKPPAIRPHTGFAAA